MNSHPVWIFASNYRSTKRGAYVSIENGSGISRNDSLRTLYTIDGGGPFEYRARTYGDDDDDDDDARWKTIKMPYYAEGWYGGGSLPAFVISDDAIMLTTMPAKTIYKSVSRQVTLNYEPLYYPGRRCKRAESLL